MGNGSKRHEYAPIDTNANVMHVWNHEKARKKQKQKSANG